MHELRAIPVVIRRVVSQTMALELSAARYTLIEFSSPLILVADDDKFTRLMLRQVLEKEGYSVLEAFDGNECLEACQRLQFALVLLDVRIPGVDGFDCCKQLQTLPGSKYTSVLMVVEVEDEALVDRTFAVGAADYVTKPIHLAVLLQRVRFLLEQSRLYRKLETIRRELRTFVPSSGQT